MKVAINSVSMMTPIQTMSETTKQTGPITSYQAQQTFANTLKDTIEKVNQQQIQSDSMTNKLINGGDVDLHEVMIASQKATITINATMEVRNKVIDAYQEIMRMSV